MKLSPFFAAIALAFSAACAQAQTTSLNTSPEGVVTYSLPATVVAQNTTSYFSAPLSSDPVYTGAVSTTVAVTANTIAVDDNPAPFVNTPNGTQLANLATPSAPYFVKFLSGLQSGRVLLVTANTASSLTLDTTDHSIQTVALTTSSFSVAAGDTFEVFPGDTLGSLFGTNPSQSQFVLKGGTSSLFSDTVSFYSPFLIRFQAYFFNTTAGFWEMSGTSTNANNTIIYPYSTFGITRRSSEPAVSFTLMGRVPEVNRLIKTVGSNSVVYDSTGYPVDMALSQLHLGNWTTGTSSIFADTLSVWDPALLRFDTYFQMSDSSWRRSGAGTTDQRNFVIPAGTTVLFVKRGTANGSTSYLQAPLPYTLN
jgi:uncharacterized protein (TIGR02597 family)